MASNLPEITAEERAAALEKARAARAARAAAKADIKAGKVTVAEAVAKAADDPVYGRMTVKALLMSAPGFGRAKTAKAMEAIGISENRRVAGMGARQREAVLALFE